MPPPTITTGVPGTASDFQREEADEGFDGDRRRALRERCLRAARERVHDVGGDLMDELAIRFGEAAQFLFETFELRAANGVESIAKGLAGSGSAHDPGKGKSGTAAILPAFPTKMGRPPDFRRPPRTATTTRRTPTQTLTSNAFGKMT
jgi:hypothetical protein